MGESASYRTISPEYGIVRTPVLAATVVAVVAAAAPVVVDATDDADAGLALYAAVVLAALGYELRRQLRRNPHRFVATSVLAQFYDQERPTSREHLVHVAATVAGVATVWHGAPPALDRRSGALLVLERWLADASLPSIDPVNAAWGIVLVVGVVLLAVGVDRLVVGAYRELRYRLAARE